ncbi:MAG: hypothetical protein WA269_03255 [Candidatus Udaeobacter sp.]
MSESPSKSDLAVIKRVTDALRKRIGEIREAIESMHKCRAKYVESVDVIETFEGKTVWDGVVEVFDISGHPQARRCYAWTFKENGEQRYVTVLELTPVNSPITAVRAAIASGQQK